MMCFRKEISAKAHVVINTTENVIFVVALVVVVILFTLPIVFYYTSDNTINAAERNNISTSFNNASFVMNKSENNDYCSSFPLLWSLQNSSSDCYKYTGTLCNDVLTQWYQCAVGKEDVSVGKTTQLQSQQENSLVILGSILDQHKSCRQVALPFLCQYFFPLVDCSTGLAYTATREDCILIKTGVCADLWALATRFGYDHYLPDCYKLPYASNDSSRVTIDHNDTNIVCRKDFVEQDSICEPRCDSFEQYSHLDTQIMIYSELTAATIAFIFSAAAIILSIKEHQTMFKYPSILVFFQLIDTTVVTTVIIITSCFRSRLYCSSTSLLHTLESPTGFCTFTGAVFQYSLVNIVLWWFCNVAIFFHKVLCPFQANRFEKMGYNKYILAAVIILCTLAPLPAVIICLSVEKFKYNITRFPATLCVSTTVMLFYSTTLPIDILIATGVCMLIVIFWYIRKKSNLFRKKTQTHLSTAEKKILLVFLSISTFGAFILAHFNNTIAKFNKFITALTHYFECEALGHIPGKCNRETFEKIHSPYMDAIAYMLMGLVTLSVLNFVLKWSSFKKAKDSVKFYIKRSTLIIRGNDSSTAVKSTVNE